MMCNTQYFLDHISFPFEKKGKFVRKVEDMTNTAIRQQLHQYIDMTDDKKIEALYTLLQNDMTPPYAISADELNILHERAEKYLRNPPNYTVEEAHSKIRQQRKKP